MKIKIRAWHKGQNKMFSAEEMAADQLTLLPTGEFINVSGTHTRLSNIINEMIPLLFTTLTDASGAEIYEGDFVQDVITVNGVKHELPIQEVVWVDEWSCFGLVPGNPYEFNHLTFSEHRRIVGNRFENPELLAEEKQ